MGYFYAHARDPVSSFTHYIGMCLAAAGCVLLLLRGAAVSADFVTMASSAVFGVSMVLLYAASALYHFYRGSDAVLLRLRKLDHSIIYVLIAGTYTPIAFHCMPTDHAAVFLGAIWSAAIVGIVSKLCWINAPRWLYTSIYLLMGWAVLFDRAAFFTLEPGCLALVAAGGICYSVGAGFYIAKRPVISENFGFHEIFHIFIMAGSLLHYLAVFLYVMS